MLNQRQSVIINYCNHRLNILDHSLVWTDELHTTVIALLELRQDTGACIHIHHSSSKIELFQPRWLSAQHARYYSSVCRIHPWDFKFSWDTGSHNQYYRNRLLCSMVGIFSSIPNCHRRSVFHYNHLLEPLCHQGASLLDKIIPTSYPTAKYQNKSYRRPTILVAKSIKGEEEIPDGVVAVLTPDVPDVLSHVSVRARNNKTYNPAANSLIGRTKSASEKEEDWSQRGNVQHLERSHLMLLMNKRKKERKEEKEEEES